VASCNAVFGSFAEFLDITSLDQPIGKTSMLADSFLERQNSRMAKSVVIEEVTDPAEIAAARAQRERSDRNAAFLEAHAKEVNSRYRGKVICVAGEELFVADTPEEATALAKAAHPEDDGSFMRYIPREKLARVYAYQR
jgi:hypothetical protein